MTTSSAGVGSTHTHTHTERSTIETSTTMNLVAQQSSQAIVVWFLWSRKNRHKGNDYMLTSTSTHTRTEYSFTILYYYDSDNTPRIAKIQFSRSCDTHTHTSTSIHVSTRPLSHQHMNSSNRAAIVTLCISVLNVLCRPMRVCVCMSSSSSSLLIVQRIYTICVIIHFAQFDFNRRRTTIIIIIIIIIVMSLAIPFSHSNQLWLCLRRAWVCMRARMSNLCRLCVGTRHNYLQLFHWRLVHSSLK